MGMSTAVAMVTGMFLFCACVDAHMHCCLSIKWVDQGVFYPFDYPACLWNQGVRIIEVRLCVGSKAITGSLYPYFIYTHVL